MMTDKGKTHKILSGSLRAPQPDFKDYSWKSEEAPVLIKEEGETEEGEKLKAGTPYEFACRGIHFWYANTKLEEPCEIKRDQHAPFIQMHFSIRNNCRYFLENESLPFSEFGLQELNLLFFTGSPMRANWQPGEEVEAFVINLSPDFFLWYLPEEADHFNCLTDSVKKKLPARLSRQNLPLTPRILSVLYEILHCPHTGKLRDIMVEARVAELLHLQLELCQQSNDCHLQNGLKKEEAEKMQLARDIILSRLSCPPTLKELAHSVGTNEHYLKTQFKQLFGTTVFGYLQNYKMEKSRELLAEGEKINDVAMALGYKHATHFTAAFKKHFGFLPHKIKAS